LAGRPQRDRLPTHVVMTPPRLVAAIAAAALIGVGACSTRTGNGGITTTCIKTYNVGLVTDVGKLADKSFNYNAWQGVQEAANDPSLCVKAMVVESNQPSDYQKNIQFLVDQGYDMVVTVGSLLADDTLAAAKANPNIRFAIVDYEYLSPIANLTGLVFREDQAGFLAGIVAAMMSASGTIGGVYGPDTPPVHRYRVGYENGAKFAVPSIKTLGVYEPPGNPTSVSDSDWGKQQATAEFGQGADVVFGVGGNAGSGALLAAAQSNKLCIGADVDQFVAYPDAGACLVTSAEKRIALAVKSAISDMVNSTLPGTGQLTFDATNGGVGISPFHNHDSKVPAAVRGMVAAAAAKLAAGILKTGAET
jgi:basic membrane protein A